MSTIEPIAGMETGLTLRQFMAAIFRSNEESSSHLSDEEIESIVRTEFMEHESVLLSLTNLNSVSATSRIRVWRSEYNRGLWDISGPYSFRYHNNLPVNRHLHPLSPEKIAELKGRTNALPDT